MRAIILSCLTYLPSLFAEIKGSGAPCPRRANSPILTTARAKGEPRACNFPGALLTDDDFSTTS